MIRRRTFLAFSVAAGGLASLGAVLVFKGYRGWVLDTLQRALPGYSFNAAGLDHFVDEYRSRHPDAMKFQLLGAGGSIFDVRALLPTQTVRYIGDEERELLTEFLLGSNFFDHARDRTKEVTYTGRIVTCRSPFAVFDV
jgi:hypothetical protein